MKYADVVLIGRIAKYEIVSDQEFRNKHGYAPNQGRILTDYARFDVLVDYVLVGSVPNTITVTWDNSTFAEPDDMPGGQYLLALRRAQSALPPLRGPSATMSPNKEPQNLTVLQASCAPPFIFDSLSKEAAAVQQILGARK